MLDLLLSIDRAHFSGPRRHTKGTEGSDLHVVGARNAAEWGYVSDLDFFPSEIRVSSRFSQKKLAQTVCSCSLGRGAAAVAHFLFDTHRENNFPPS